MYKSMAKYKMISFLFTFLILETFIRNKSYFTRKMLIIIINNNNNNNNNKLW